MSGLGAFSGRSRETMVTARLTRRRTSQFQGLKAQRRRRSGVRQRKVARRSALDHLSGQARPFEARTKGCGFAGEATRFAHDQPEDEENGDQRHAEQDPRHHLITPRLARDSILTFANAGHRDPVQCPRAAKI
jgi:hypothetical protein